MPANVRQVIGCRHYFFVDEFIDQQPGDGTSSRYEDGIDISRATTKNLVARIHRHAAPAFIRLGNFERQVIPKEGALLSSGADTETNFAWP